MEGHRPLDILIIGRGRMGQAVHRLARQRGHNVVASFGRNELSSDAWPEVDVAVDFTLPKSALDVFAACRSHGVPLVSGTTGWIEHWADVESSVREAGHAMLWAPNFSIGIHLYRKALRQVASMMQRHGEFAPSIHEVHHTGKRDAPSGTARALGADLDALGVKGCEISAQRLAGVPGTHEVKWQGPMDAITLTHSALNRDGFAAGAVMAAEWLQGCSGPFDRIYGMEDVWG